MLSMDRGSNVNAWVRRKKEIDKLFKSYKPQKQCSGNNLYKGGHVPQTQNMDNLIEKKLHVDNKILYTFRFSLISRRMQCKEAPSPVMSICDNPAAQHKIIDQRVIARPSKTSHQQWKQIVHVSNQRIYGI